MNTVLTPAGLNIITSTAWGINPHADMRNTLNLKYDVATDRTEQNEPRVAKYLGLGTGGVDYTGQSDISALSKKRRLSYIPDLYSPVPLVLRLPSNDLTSSQAEKYRMRTTIVINDITYIAYYLLDVSVGLTSRTPTLTISDGLGNHTPYLGSNTSLPDDPSKLIVKSSITSIVGLDGFGVTEVLNALSILYPDDVDGFYSINEMGIYSGIDVDVDGFTEGSLVELYSSAGVSKSFETNVPVTYTLTSHLSQPLA